jgi:hypothetical protein
MLPRGSPGAPPPGWPPPNGQPPYAPQPYPPQPYPQQPYPPQGYGSPPGYPPQGAPPKGDPPKWLAIVARVVLVIGILLVVATAIGGASSEQTGVDLATITGGPLGFGIVATIMTRRGSGSSVGKPLGCGCATGLALSLLIVVFFVAIFPKL